MSHKTVQLRKAQAAAFFLCFFFFFAFFPPTQCTHPFWDQASNIKPFFVSGIVGNFLGSILSIPGKEKIVASILAELKWDWHKS